MARSARRRIGLLGGSFNPAHDGHVHISRAALDQLDLDGVWWLVSPQNPLKTADEMADYDRRLAYAEHIARSSRIVVSDLERQLGTTYTADTLTVLKAEFPNVQFVWLMGADNLRQMNRWTAWKTIFSAVPIAVFDRPSYSLRALNGPAAKRFSKARVPATKARALADMRPPAWVFLRTPWNPRSATQLRTRGRWAV